MNRKTKIIKKRIILGMILAIAIIFAIIVNINKSEEATVASKKATNDTSVTTIQQNSIQARQLQVASDATADLGKTIEANIVMGNTTTIVITGVDNGTYQVTNVDGNFLDYTLIDNKITITGKKEGTTSITVKETTTAKTLTLNLTILPANYSIKSANKTVYYGTLADAIAAANSGDTIIVCKTVTDTAVTIDKDITINLKSNTITISKSKKGITVNSGKTLNITGNATGKIEIAGGTVETEATKIAEEDHYAIYNQGTLNIKNGKVSGISFGRNGYAIYNKGTLNVENGEVSGTGYNWGIGISNEGKATISGGKVVGDTSKTELSSTGISNDNGGTINLTGGEISGQIGIMNYYSSNNVVEIAGGTIVGTKGSGIWNSGKIVIGDATKEINAETPTIIGKLYGVQNNDGGVFKFYNGSTMGETESYKDSNSTPPILRTNTQIVVETSGNYKVARLKLQYNYTIEKENSTKGYVELQDAINAASSGDVIKATQNVTLTSAVTVNKKVTLDLQSYDITVGINSITIASGAELTVTTPSYGSISTGSSLADSKDGCVLINNGTLILDKGEIEAYSGKSAKAYGIKNTGTLTVVNADILARGDTLGVGIQNNGGNVTITDGIINGQGTTYSSDNQVLTNATVYGIYNDRAGTVTVGDQAKEIDIESPEIIANYTSGVSRATTAYGVYNKNGTFNFYNGVIKSQQPQYYYNIEPVIREATKVATKEDENYNMVYLESTAKALNQCEATLEKSSYTYDGTAKQPKVTVKDGETTLTEGTDYTVTYSNNTNAGTATATISAKSAYYTGTKSVTFTISKKSLSSGMVTLGTTNYTYDGKAKTPTVTVKNGSKTLTKGTDYTVTYSNNTNVGTAVAKVTGTGNYTGTVTKNFAIVEATETKTSLSDCIITLSEEAYTYDGTAKQPKVTIKNGTTTLTEGTDYTITYTNNTNVGTGTVTITGKGDYIGTITKNFTISEPAKKELNQCEITLEKSSYAYDGTEKRPKVTVKDGGTTLTEGTDYTLTYSNNTNVGTASITVTGKGNYTGTATEEFEIRSSTAGNNSSTSGSNYSSTSGTSSSTSNTSISGKKDSTTSNTILPAAGSTVIKLALFFIVAVIAIIAFIKYRNMKDIK